ncbi:hypothetical protein SASPL_118131 [Salvia splendens]|uniref:Uncharacterized protein n=1 Tax=Salvia splendens TaxID=180675 RepID=A0A8X8ZZL3_SALSN|nr:hypothetical protein SASPL_118131 [Salvia splendens]
MDPGSSLSAFCDGFVPMNEDQCDFGFCNGLADNVPYYDAGIGADDDPDEGDGEGVDMDDNMNDEEAARQRDLRDIENDDLRQQVRDLQRDIENGDLRQQIRDLQRRLARLEKRRGKSNPMRSNASERRSVDDPLFNDVQRGQSKPVYDKDILSMPVYDKSIYDEDILSMPVVYDTPVYDEDIFYELSGLISGSPPLSVIFGNAVEDEGVVVDDDEEYDEDIFNNGAADEDNTASVVLIEDIMEKLVKETFVSKAAGDSYVINTKKNFDYEFDAVKEEVDLQVGFGILDQDPVKEFGFVGHEFDGYSKRMMHDIQNWNCSIAQICKDTLTEVYKVEDYLQGVECSIDLMHAATAIFDDGKQQLLVIESSLDSH